eukprot:Skav211551  [mRNA]  locus=scaffold871:253125:280639:- [translate_table: standard]
MTRRVLGGKAFQFDGDTSGDIAQETASRALETALAFAVFIAVRSFHPIIIDISKTDGKLPYGKVQRLRDELRAYDEELPCWTAEASSQGDRDHHEALHHAAAGFGGGQGHVFEDPLIPWDGLSEAEIQRHQQERQMSHEISKRHVSIADLRRRKLSCADEAIARAKAEAEELREQLQQAEVEGGNRRRRTAPRLLPAGRARRPAAPVRAPVVASPVPSPERCQVDAEAGLLLLGHGCDFLEMQSMAVMGGAAYQILLQSKLLVTALIMWAMRGQRQTILQWNVLGRCCCQMCVRVRA